MSRIKATISKVMFVAIVGVGCLTLSSVLAGVPKAAPENNAEPFDPPAVYLTWQHDPTTTMTIQWHSNGGRDDGVQYQRLDERVWRTTRGSHHPMPHSGRTVHTAELTDLMPGTDYRFRFGENSVEFKFRTMPSDMSKPIRFAVGGDTMDGFDMLDEWYEETCRLVAKEDPMFTVIGGDIAYANGNGKLVKRWYRWLAGWKKYMVTSDGRLIPFVVAIGNHEVQGGFNQTPDKAPYFYSLFAMPGQRGYGVLDFGRYLSLVLLDSGHTHPIDGKQTDWLRRTLADRQDVPHLFAVYHVPAYPSVRNFDNGVSARIREHWVPLFEQFGVDVAFEHHDHVYKRTHPIRAHKVDPRGVLYLGDGAWGAMLRRPRDRWYLAKTASKRHFSLVTVGQSRSFLAIDSEGQIFDRVTHQ
ncbi:MAG: fibronectin type III domain-containing protein [Candidatus Methylomirabilales bacterium]